MLVVAITLNIMGKVKLPKKVMYPNKFNPAWQSDPIVKFWLIAVPGDSTYAMCHICKSKTCSSSNSFYQATLVPQLIRKIQNRYVVHARFRIFA